MSAVKRFFYVISPRGKTLHLKYGNTSEGPTKCGRSAVPGWEWYTKALKSLKRIVPICKQCDT